MLYKRNYLLSTAILATLLLLTACGGSSSSSGGGTTFFVGVQNIRITMVRLTSPPRGTAFRLDRVGDQVTVIDRDFEVTTTLVGENFTIVSPTVEVQAFGTVCDYSLTYSGRVTQSGVSGTLTGPLDCGFPGTLNGDFQATAVSANSSTVVPSVSVFIGG